MLLLHFWLNNCGLVVLKRLQKHLKKKWTTSFALSSHSLPVNTNTFTEMLVNNPRQPSAVPYNMLEVYILFLHWNTLLFGFMYILSGFCCFYCLHCIILLCCHSFILSLRLHSGSVDTYFHCASFLFCMLLAPLLLLLPATPTARGGVSPGRGRSWLKRRYRRKKRREG